MNRMMFRTFLLATLTVTCGLAATARGVEQWSDPKLPVKDAIRVWLDATYQPAAWEANGKALVGSEPVDVWFDASGNRRHFTQPVADDQPTYAEGGSRAAIRFDGKDDHLR